MLSAWGSYKGRQVVGVHEWSRTHLRGHGDDLSLKGMSRSNNGDGSGEEEKVETVQG